MTEEVEDILYLLETRREKGSEYFYKPLDRRRSRVIRQWYTEQLPSWCQCEGGAETLSTSGVVVANGYTRVVIGDYGAFVEFTLDQASEETKAAAARSTGGRKYNWLTVGHAKVYYQLATVAYADYKPNHLYIDPSLVTPCPPTP